MPQSNALRMMTPSERAEVMHQWARDVTRARDMGDALREIDAPSIVPEIRQSMAAVPARQPKPAPAFCRIDLSRLDALIEEAQAIARDQQAFIAMLQELREAGA